MSETPFAPTDNHIAVEAELARLKWWVRQPTRSAETEIRDGERSPAGGFRLSKLSPSLHMLLSDELGIIGGALGLVSRASRAFFLLDSLPAETGSGDDTEGLYLRMRSQVAGFFPEFNYATKRHVGRVKPNDHLLRLVERLFRGRRSAQRFTLPEVDLKLFGKSINPVWPEFYSYLPDNTFDDSIQAYRSPFTSSEEIHSVTQSRIAHLLCGPGEILFFLYGWRVILRVLQTQAIAARCGGDVDPFLDSTGNDEFCIKSGQNATFNPLSDIDFEGFARDLVYQADLQIPSQDVEPNNEQLLAIYPEIMLKSHEYSDFAANEAKLGREYIPRHTAPRKLNLWPEWKALGFVYEQDGTWYVSLRFRHFLQYFLGLFENTSNVSERTGFAQAILATKQRFAPALADLKKWSIELQASNAASWPVRVSKWPTKDFELQRIFRAFFHHLVAQEFRKPENPDEKPPEVYQALRVLHSYARFPILPYFLVYHATAHDTTSAFGHLVLPLHKSRSFAYEVPGLGLRNEILFGLFTINFEADAWSRQSIDLVADTSRIGRDPDAVTSGILRLRTILREICTPLIERGFYDEEFAAEKKQEGKQEVILSREDAFGHDVRHLAEALGARWVIQGQADTRQLPSSSKIIPFPELLDAAKRTLCVWSTAKVFVDMQETTPTIGALLAEAVSVSQAQLLFLVSRSLTFEVEQDIELFPKLRDRVVRFAKTVRGRILRSPSEQCSERDLLGGSESENYTLFRRLLVVLSDNIFMWSDPQSVDFSWEVPGGSGGRSGSTFICRATRRSPQSYGTLWTLEHAERIEGAIQNRSSGVTHGKDIRRGLIRAMGGQILHDELSTMNRDYFFQAIFPSVA